MEIRLLRSFQVLAQQGHFGRAARALHLSQPALTKQMRQLEEEVGGPLFTRGRHGAQLTSAGVLFREEADLAAVIDLALEVHSVHLSREHVAVERAYDPQAPRLVLPRAKIAHVMVNLVKNAVESMSRVPLDARRLQVEVRREGERVEARIRDTGEGIPRENLERIFTYGYTTKADGHGFGLHTCANYVRQMGGTIRVRSDGPGRGAEFTVSFEAGSGPRPA